LELEKKSKFPLKIVFTRARTVKRYSAIQLGLLVALERGVLLKLFFQKRQPIFLRQYGDDFLYDSWDHDLMAVSDYTKQDARTFQLYLRKRYQKYKPA
jgi:hypothetical protein